MLLGWSTRSWGSVQFDAGRAQSRAPAVLAAEAEGVDLPPSLSVAALSLTLSLPL